MSLSPEDVRKVADLARLELPEAEVEAMAGNLSAILGHIEKLNELDTDDVKPTSHVVATSNVFREDEVKDRFEKGRALDNAPAPDQNYFSVPRVIE